MNPLSGNSVPRFGRIHVLSRQVNDAFNEAFTSSAIPRELPREARQRMRQGEKSFYALMGDDESEQLLYYRLKGDRAIILTNKDTEDLDEFQAQRKVQKEHSSRLNKREFCERFLTEKSMTQFIHWVYGPNDPDAP